MRGQQDKFGTPVEMKLKSEWFRHAYYVYLVSVVDAREGRRFIYVGQTGDRAHLMARSPFYRMSGHFQQGRSTQNQVVKGLRDRYEIDDLDQKRLVAKLLDMDIAYRAYPLAEFEFGVSREKHQELRRCTERVETALIDILRENLEWDVLNKKRGPEPGAGDLAVGEAIFEDWRGSLGSSMSDATTNKF